MRRCVLALALLCAGGYAAAGETAGEKAGKDEPVLRASVDWLVNVLPDSGGGQEEVYGGRTLLVDGWIEEMGRDAGGWHIVLRRQSSRRTHVRCYFPAGMGGQMDYLFKGATVELMGECEGYDARLDAVVLRDCRLIVSDIHEE